MNDRRSALVNIKNLVLISDEIAIKEVKDAMDWAKINKVALVAEWRKNNP